MRFKKTAFLLIGLISIAAYLGINHAQKTRADIPFYQPNQPAYVWYAAGQKKILDAQKLFPGKKRAKNVILFVGDGMGIPTITTTRILAGQQQNQTGESYQLSFEKFPHLALSKTYNTNQQVPDSAGTMTAMITGVKTSAGVLSVDETVKVNETNNIQTRTLKTLIEEAEEQGLATGIVTTTRITHATPGAAYAHIANRDWEADSQLPEAAKNAGVADIALQLIQFSSGDGINLILGGGSSYFLPQSEKGLRDDGRNLIAEWKQKYSDGVFVSDNQSFDAIDWKKTNHVLGLFTPSHMSYNVDRNDGPHGEPSLSEMTEKAIAYLSRYPEGYVLIVEGGRIDHGHHEGNAYRALTDAVEFANAVAMANETTNADDTLIIVTADHSHVMTMNGYPILGNPIFEKVVQWNEITGNSELALDKNGLPYTTLQYANGPSARQRTDLTHIDTTLPDYHQDALVPFENETHGGEDVAIYARGPGSQWLQGTVEQHVIYHVMRQALGH